jgi:hypothetical protein
MPPASELSGLSEASLRELQKDANEQPDSSTLAFFRKCAIVRAVLPLWQDTDGIVVQMQPSAPFCSSSCSTRLLT